MFSAEFEKLASSDTWIKELAKKYQDAKPFPHILLNDVIEKEELRYLVTCFPQPDNSWWQYNNQLERKFAKDDITDQPHIIQELIYMNLHSRFFVTFLEKLSGIPNLIVDHTLRGGGLHQIARGGNLYVHADHNIHPNTGLDRRLNVILYLNPEWQEEYGGYLEFWNKDMTACEAKIPPLLGNMAIFSTTSESYHGHPDPLTCPEGMTRKSIATYYWTNGRPEHERREKHSTIYKQRPQDPKDQSIEELIKQRAKGRLES